MKTAHQHNYYPHIDGLRAIAVLSVIIYHIDNSWLPSGFVGVDVFFVISGFLITNIIIKKAEANTFTYTEFYKKRIKRILPLYFLVSFISSIFALLIFFPEDLVDFAGSLAASNFFVSNYYFWRTTDYFATSTELKPLVHTWSLAVEEQFYIFWPVVLVVLSKYCKSKTLHFFLLFFIVSYVASYFLSPSNPNFAYYAIITRSYELIIGAALSFFSVKHNWVRWYFSYIGMFMIFISLFIIKRTYAFPGTIAVVPCIGAALLILSGNVNSLPIKLLNSKLFVFIGGLSYSLYMWHWPMLAFAKYYFTVLEPLVVFSLVLTLFLVSYASTTFVEKKIIQSNLGFKKSFFFFFVFPSITILAFSIYLTMREGLPERFSDKTKSLITQQIPNPNSCSKIKVDINFNDECILGHEENDDTIKVLLWGDSHANHFYGFFEELSNNENIITYIKSFPGCPPIKGIYRVSQHYSEICYRHNNAVFNELVLSNKFDIIALSANWVNYPLGPHLSDNLGVDFTIDNSHSAFYRGLKSELDILNANKQKVVILPSVPNYPFNAGMCYLKSSHFNSILPKDCSIDIKKIQDRNAELEQYFSFVSTNKEYIDVVNLKSFFCDEKSCSPNVKGELYYRDGNHLSYSGSKQLYKNMKSLREAFDDN